MTESIAGLFFLDNWQIKNGGDSTVTPFPSCRPFNIVFHGSSKFHYGQYGIHLGQEDRLTFLGRCDAEIVAQFIDCRASSPTFRKRQEMHFYPKLCRTLVIPPGVAHTFSDLSNIVTINSYRIFLPKASDWIRGDTDWDLGRDILNVPLDVADDDIPSLKPNTETPSNMFYKILADRQRSSVDDFRWQHALTEDVALENGEKYRIRFREPAKQKKIVNTREQLFNDILDIEWVNSPFVETGLESGIVPMYSERPFYIVDHGQSTYEHDAYGVHIGQEDNLTFIGPAGREIVLQVADCRRDSETFGQKRSIKFEPDPTKTLRIPPGVSHAFRFDPGIATINQPMIFLNENNEYDSQNDVIDLPLNKGKMPGLRPNKRPAKRSYYESFVRSQLKMIKNPASTETPMVLLAKDHSGELVRVAIRKSSEAH